MNISLLKSFVKTELLSELLNFEFNINPNCKRFENIKIKKLKKLYLFLLK